MPWLVGELNRIIRMSMLPAVANSWKAFAHARSRKGQGGLGNVINVDLPSHRRYLDVPLAEASLLGGLPFGKSAGAKQAAMSGEFSSS
ncbi:hypothetical protein [Sinorhizobium sp. NFACC03]|uniref:hypothetical protein n=1 Tax=Sinorhizobium sp. NFACC03 TaxID=1566295 RepID=UPI000889080E|nr:hypothetical protein [Sinorhizobium sp. NFACC03]SDA62036.1 hypothetical protein SAMN03159448_01797 [Sinorhizobium sp. NFACC03]